MRIYLMTDLEGVAGVRDFQEWTGPGKPYYELARQLLTQEVNAAVDGFFAGGAESVMVADGHGPGAVSITELDSRVELLRGWGRGWPLGLEEDDFDAIAWVGQHAKSRTELSNMAHTQGCSYLEFSINGVALGEFGQMVACASERGVRSIFAAGELALAEEAKALVPGIETVWGKRGTVPGRGDDCSEEQYRLRNKGAVHSHPEKVRRMIRDGAKRAVRRAKTEDFGLLTLTAPYKATYVWRQTADKPRTYAITEHPDSVAGLLNTTPQRKEVESDERLRELLVD